LARAHSVRRLTRSRCTRDSKPDFNAKESALQRTQRETMPSGHAGLSQYAAEARWIFRLEHCELVHIQRQSSRAINSQLRWGLRSKSSRPRKLTAPGAHDMASK